MALSAATVWEVRNAGSDTNGGGFVTGASGTDWSQQNSAQYSVTDGVTNGTTTITSATAAFGTDVVGNIIYVQGGTGGVLAAWYQIISRTNATTIVVDRTTGLSAGTGVTLHIGGALASIGQAGAVCTVAGMITFVKQSSTYSITSATNNVAGGVVSGSAAVTYCGYSTTRTLFNTDTSPTLQTNVSTATQLTSTGSVDGTFINFILDGNSQTSAKATAGGNFFNCLFKNFNTASSGTLNFHFCVSTANSAAVFVNAGLAEYCWAHANTATPFSNCAARSCIADSNTGASTDGFLFGGGAALSNCVSYNNGRDGYRSNTTGKALLVNCIAETNAGFGYNDNSQGTAGTRLLYNFASYNNTSGGINGTTHTETGSIAYSTSAFVAAGSANFQLNTTSGGGASLRAVGYPATFAGGSTTNYRDIGAAQHQDPSAAGMLFIPDLQGT